MVMGAPEDAVALFQLIGINAGFLDTVRGIVATAIQMTEDAGESIFDARLFLTLGDGLRLEEAFAKAYEAYRRAYREAVRER